MNFIRKRINKFTRKTKYSKKELLIMDRELRDSAESMLRNVSGDYSHSYNRSIMNSVNLLAEEVALGHRVRGSMSSVRRFFCLLITFDLLFTSLLWLICIVLPGGDLKDIFLAELLQYNVKKSLIDIVGVSACRFLILIIFYAAAHINNSSVVAITTSFTNGFLIGKVFLYEWVSAKEPVYSVLLILISFVLSWAEAWYLDVQVLPQEQKCAHIIEAINSDRGATERTPLLAGNAHSYAHSTVDFFTASNTRCPSPTRLTHHDTLLLTNQQIEEFKSLSQAEITKCWQLLTHGGWKFDRKGECFGDSIEILDVKPYGKIFKFTGLLDCPARWLFEDLMNNYESLPDWNQSVRKATIIKKITSSMDIVHQISHSQGFGMIGQRDFVLLRTSAGVDGEGRVCRDGTGYVVSCVSVDLAELAPSKHCARATLKINSWFLQPTSQKTSSGKIEEKCKYKWIFCCDPNVKFLLKSMVDKNMPGVMLTNVQYLRAHIDEARRKTMGKFCADEYRV